MNRRGAVKYLNALAEHFEDQNLRFIGGYIREAVSALCAPAPDPITGLVPCGCGGKATRSYSSIGCVVFCSTCGCTTKSVFFASEAVKVWNTAMGWKGGAE